MSSAGTASLAVSGALRLLSATWKTSAAGEERLRRLRSAGEPFLYALWHGRMLLPIWRHRGQGIATMASKSKDGEIIARWLTRNGYAVVRGSTWKGGARGIVRLLRCLEEGRSVALTVDGPKGPPRLVQEGILMLARKANAWIMPVSASATHPRFLRSWDRYLLPRAFSRNVVVYGEPFRLGRETDAEAAAFLKDALDAATAEADRRMGIAAPPPW
jgi:lysophospholipid acyltransferase (LPLAT)-like uncharacterized protein